MRFERLSIEQGLSQSVGLSISQDSEGFMWFGTYDGLNRFDGYQFKRFDHVPEVQSSLSNSIITVLYTDSKGTLWIGTEGGLNRYDGDTGEFFHFVHDDKDDRSLSHNVVSAIAEDKQGRLWVATAGGGLNLLAENQRQFIRFTHQVDDEQSLSHNNVNALLKDRRGRLWVGSDAGLSLLLNDKGHFRHRRHDTQNPQSLSHNKVQSLFEDAQGRLWVGTFGGGLNLYDIANDRFRHYRHDEKAATSLLNDFVWSINQDAQGMLWVGTEGGLSKLDLSLGVFHHSTHQSADPYSLASDVVRHIFRDNRGMMWLGTFGGGINRVDTRRRQFGHYKHIASDPSSLSFNLVFSLQQDNNGDVWIGTLGGGLNRQDAQNKTMERFYLPEQPSSYGYNSIWTVYQQSQSHLLLGTRSGVYQFDKAQKRFSRFDYAKPDEVDEPDSVTAILRDNQGQYWFGTWGQGLVRFNPNTKQYQRFHQGQGSINHDIILAMTLDHQGNIWIGTNDGLTRYDAHSQSFVNFKHDEKDLASLTSGYVTSIYQDSLGDIWVATSSGLNKWLGAERGFSHYTEANGLPNDVIYCIAEDSDKRLWLSTNRGLSAFNRSNGSFNNYDPSDGLQSNEFNHNACTVGPTGEMFFGGVNGFNRFYPEKLTPNNHPPHVVLTDFLLANQSVPIGTNDHQGFALEKAVNRLDTVYLGYRQNLFSFEFAALDHQNPLKNRYRYMLEGYDQDWLNADAKIRLATYTNLPAGQYRLKVQGSNANGIWNTEGAAVNIVVSPPPWLSWWAITLYVVSLLFTVWSIAFFFGQRKNERKVIAQLQELDKLKDDFLAKMSHEIRTPMNAVVGLSRLALNAKTEQERREHISTVLESGDALLELINDILDFSKLSAGQMTIERTQLDLCEVLTQTFNQCALRAHEQGLSLAVATETAIPKGLLGDPLRIRQVLVNLVNNAVKFTDSGGVWINIRFSRNEDGRLMLVCTVNDTGCGMSKAQQNKLFKSYVQADASVSRTHGGTGLGLAIAKQLCELMGGRIWVESEQGKGSSFHFTVALERDSKVLNSEVPFSGFRILLIESVDFARQAILTQLKAYDAVVDDVTCVEQAQLKMAQANEQQMPYNLILADWTLSELEGLLRQIKREQSETLLMFMVGRYDKERFRRKFFDAADLNVIDKPVLPHLLYRAIRQLQAGEALADSRLGPSALRVPDLSAYRILMVEDNAINRQVAAGFLDYTGVDIESAENGLVAIEKLKEQRFDLVLMDIDMPKLDGLSATKLIKQELGLEALPIVAMTGYASQGDFKRFDAAGMQGHITKPFEQQSLYRVVGDLLPHEEKTVMMGPVEALKADKLPEVPNLAEKLSQISGLDVRRAVARLSGHEELYYELIKRFHRHEGALLKRLEKAYDSKDWQALNHCAHSLKSMAAFIGAEELSDLAKTLEDKLSQGEQDERLYWQVRDHLQVLLDSVNQVLAHEMPSEEQAFDGEKFITQLRTLITLLQATDFDAEMLLEQMRLHCHDSEFNDDVETMIALVDDVEFEQALAHATGLLQRCEAGALKSADARDMDTVDH